MPDRILRDELLESERWLILPRNTHRLAFICLLTVADALGNLEGSPGRLWRLWRDALALTDRKEIQPIVDALTETDLIRPYKVDGRDLIHIPRTRQRLRYIGRVLPLSPWTTDEEKQRLSKQITGRPPGESQAHAGPSPGAHQAKRSEEKRSRSEALAFSIRNVVTPTSTTPVDNLKPETPTTKPKPTAKANGQAMPRWDQSDAGIDAKARELGINAKPGETYFEFKQRLWQAINERKRGPTTTTV